MDNDGNNNRIHRSDLCHCDQSVCIGEIQMIVKVVLGTMQNARKLVSIAEAVPYDAELCCFEHA